ncbi:ATP-dependent helicase HrpB [Aquamicrobium segne]|uniref:ATP-dependent helicase HrpB n=1 Tax=Aquamicrobium segne TaxID=469547 RepID=A0ABW0GWE6_9HYPH
MSTALLPHLPVTAILGDLGQVLEQGNKAVLVAPPGAGKTTLVPLALLEAGWRKDGTILLLEPRRLAARAAARRMASLLDEKLGGTVGYAMRMEKQVSQHTRILVVTEGVLARMILDDPELPGISAVIFDEFHERSLDGDFGLALALDVQEGLRPDLRLLVMSATLDGAGVAKLLGDAPVLESEGRSFPVTIHYRERPSGVSVEDAMAAAIRDALAQETGSVLAFLPGQREIMRVMERLEGRVGTAVDIVPLYGLMEAKAQDAAIRASPPGRRKIVLATAIAETSITIDGVCVVIDSGLARLPAYEPASGLTRLETVRVSRASADQRAGRAGRTQPGVAIRLWRAEQTAALPAFTPPEILAADLSGLVLDCAAFGIADPTSLTFLDTPPGPALNEARNLLRVLGAIDADGRQTDTGQAMRRLALPVRLAHMVAQAACNGHERDAALLAVLLTERGLGGDSIDLERRLMRFADERTPRANAARQLALGLAQSAGKGVISKASISPGALLLYAWPDRVAKARGERGRFVLANGSGAMLDMADALAGERFLVIADVQGRAQNARIMAAASVHEDDIRTLLSQNIKTRHKTLFDLERKAVRVREQSRLGAIALSEKMLPAPSGDAANIAMLEAVKVHGLGILPWDKPQDRPAMALRQRLAWLRQGLGEPWPDMADAALLSRLEEWLLPFLTGSAALSSVSGGDLKAGLSLLVPYDLQRRINALAPTHFAAPSGSHVPIRYDGEEPVLAIRVQELFGLGTHPAIADGVVKLTLELLSPAHRPIQTTRDLPGFWQGSWADVRAQMRGRYPKHNWPENPLLAQATSRAKPRGT